MKSISRSLRRLGGPTCALALFAMPCAAQTSTIPPPPQTATDTVTETIHGTTVTDPYRWLEDGSSEKTRAWIHSEQQYTESLLSHRPEMEGLRKDVLTLTDIEEAQRVLFRAGRYYLLKKIPGDQVASLYVREGEHGAEKKIIDASGLSADHSDTIDLLNVSRDGDLVAYGVRKGGRDQLSIHFYDVRAGHDLADVLPEARYIYWSLPITPDGKRVYYIKFDDAGPRIYEHAFGSGVESDALVFGSGIGPEMILQTDLSAEGDLLLISVLHGAAGSTDIYFKDVRAGQNVRVIVKDVSATFVAAAAGGRIYIETNWKAPNGKIVVVDPAQPEPDHWKTVIEEGKNAIEMFRLAGGGVLVNYMADAHSELRAYRADGSHARTVALPGIGSVATIDTDWNSPVVCFSYTSFQTPTTFFSYSLSSGKQVVLSAPAAIDRLKDVVVEQVWYPSKDGTRVPMFLAHRRDIVRDGNLPVLLYGYGGFTWAQLPTFSPETGVWLERGGVYAVANIRGGNEFGEAWHKAGYLEKKQNSFDDFLAAAQWLIDSKYTNPRRLAIQGLSNGGLLVTASITQRPDLFAAAIGRYPLIDMVRYERFSIARWWATEYGSASDPAQFKTLYAYSPYHHVKQGTRYPAVLLVSGDGDTRVDPSHSRKMTAMLQNASSSDRPVLLLYDSKSGHSGSLSTQAEVEQTSNELAFLLWQLGVGDLQSSPGAGSH